MNKIDIEQEVPHLRFNWSASEIEDILRMPFIDLLYRAQTVHRQFHPEKKVQLSSLLSIKTGGCKEDCKYCSQSAHHAKKTGLKYEPLMDVELVVKKPVKESRLVRHAFAWGRHGAKSKRAKALMRC